MSEEKVIKDYDIFTGKCGNDFWNPTTINHKDGMVVPVPLDPNRNISDITSSYLFQETVSRFYTAPNHMPVPIIIGYDKANVSWQGGLVLVPVIFTYGGISHHYRHQTSSWRCLGCVPNLSVGVSKRKLADEKQVEHHLCLREIFCDFEDLCKEGGFITTIRGKILFLSFSFGTLVVTLQGTMT